MQKMGRFGAVRGHSRSWAMSPFDRAHTTSYSTLIETMRLSCTVFDMAGYLSKVDDFDPPHLHLAPPQGVTPVVFRGDLWLQKTRVPGLSCGVCVILCLAVLVEHRLVTDRHRAMASTTDALHRAVKMEKYSFERGIIAVHICENYTSLLLLISEEAWQTRCTSFSSEHRYCFTIVCQMAPLPRRCTAAMENGGIAAIQLTSVLVVELLYIYFCRD